MKPIGFVNKALSDFFYTIGYRVGQRPRYSILGSILVSLLCGTGLFWASYENNLERLYTNKHGPYDLERQYMETYFPASAKGSFDPSRLLRIGRFARLIIVAKDGGTLFRKSVWNEIREVDSLIHRTSFKWKDSVTYNYTTLCGRWQEDCFENKFLDLGDVMDQIENGTLAVSYPIMLNPETFNSHVIPLHFGGLTLTNDSYSVAGVKAINLIYVLAVDDDEEDERGYEWEGKILEALEPAIPTYKNVTVYRQTFKSFAQEQDRNVLSVIPYTLMTILFMMIFLLATSISTDWVRAKPWAATLGMLCAVFGTLAGAGIMSFCGFPIIAITIAVPFIMLGIGIDDTFVILAAWRQTDELEPVPKRLADCFSEAGVSITITTLTDMLSFYVGLMTPIPSVQIFSAFAGTCVLWIYIFQLFLFGGILAISGEQEAENRHGMRWWGTATPRSKAVGKSKMFRIFCTGGIDRDDPHNPENRSKKLVMSFFRDEFSNILLTSLGKFVIMFLFVVYLVIACYGLTTMEEGLQLKRIYREDSYLYEYIEKEIEYFRHYPHRAQILILSPLDYSNKTVQKQVFDMLEQFTSLKHLTQQYSENWLRSYTRYVDAYSELFDWNVTDEQSFIDTLRGEYLNGTPSVFSEDVKFNEDYTKIIASRFIIQGVDLIDSKAEKDLVMTGRRIAADPTRPFNVSVYHPWFHFVDQYIIIQSLTIQLIATAASIVMLVAIAFIPNLLSSFLVFVTIATIEVGVMGFMCLWGISLDMISLLCLIMCIGFSVDFTAHISYAYVTAEGSAEERIRKALFGLGLPIVQGGVSTIIGVASLFLIPSYIFQTFAKVVFLVIVFAAWHGLFVLPVALLLIRPERFSLSSSLWSTKKTYIVTQPPPAINYSKAIDKAKYQL